MKYFAISLILILLSVMNCSSGNKRDSAGRRDRPDDTKDIVRTEEKPGKHLPETRDPLRISELHYASRDGNEAVVRNIINGSVKIDLNVQDNDGMTPLHYAAEWGNRNIAANLIAKGADVNARNIYGSPPLAYAKNQSIADLLISKGADVNIRDKWGETPLFWAVESGNFNLVSLILSRGGDVNAVNFEKDTPLHNAVHYGNGYAHVDIVNTLIKKGAGIHLRDMYGWTPLHEGVEKGRYDLVLLLLNKGADVNGTTLMDNERHGIAAMSTPLHIAIRRYDENMNMINLLISRGANLKLKDMNGMTPYALALHESRLPDDEWYGTAVYKLRKRQGLVKIVEMLKKSEGGKE